MYNSKTAIGWLSRWCWKLGRTMSKDVAVLVVDDDGATRETLRTMFEYDGYTVYDAPDGTSALTRLRSGEEPLVVVLDWWMPGLDGLQVLRAIAADDASLARRHAFILLSAAIDQYDAPRVPVPSDIRVTVLSKPYDMNKLLVAVATAAATLGTTTRDHD